MTNNIQIDGVFYEVVINDIIGPFERLESIKPGQAIRYYDKFMYRTASGECRACYADDPSNNWDI